MRPRAIGAAIVASAALASAACGSSSRPTPSASRGQHHAIAPAKARHGATSAGQAVPGGQTVPGGQAVPGGGQAVPGGGETVPGGGQGMASGAPITSGGTFGDLCARLPATGTGSISWMASVPLATAVAGTPVLHDFGRAISAAGLTGRLNSARSITVFAPDNAAFAALGAGNFATLKATKADLARVLEYHVVSGRRTPADLATGKHLTTLRGTVIVPVKTRDGYKVNHTDVVCGNIQTANATIYIVNEVLVPLP
jgi:uncharacterized surface protein with fasciclin (FAS1) repeats